LTEQADHFGSLLPHVHTRPPGRASRDLAARLRAVESRNVTFDDGAWPVFWDEARGCNVRDPDGNVYLDLTSAFGVALLGHAHPTVVAAVQDQASRLMHGMGDVHPPVRKLELLEKLCAISPWDDARAVLASTGAEAVEIALKTAHLATGRPGVIAFEGGYHGLTSGALSTTEREHFRGPFRERLYGGVTFAPFPDFLREGAEGTERVLNAVRRALDEGAANGDPVGAVIIEPVQGRGGVRLAPHGFMAALSRIVAESGALLIADEIFTGLGRCGALLASDRVELRPDIVCLGKALGGGMPISACIAPRSVMDAWPKSEGEAIHTSTFLGHPVACAAALAVLSVLEDEAVVERSWLLGSQLLKALRGRLHGVPGVHELRGLGLLAGIEFEEAGRAVAVAEAALAQGVLLLPAGDRGQVLEIAPPADLSDAQAEYAVEVISRLVRGVDLENGYEPSNE
jgi:4-aminobutyrate aminotransferase-like enzyme